jgi:phospholipase C
MSYPNDPIKHVVLLLLENHSFDQMLGSLKAVYPSLEGVDVANPGINKDKSGKIFQQSETRERQVISDPHHEVPHVAVQLKNGNAGFVEDFEASFPNATDEEKQNIMGYYPLDFLPALHSLARNFTVCDHWFSSLPGPTWPNRFFALSGTSSGFVDMPDDGAHKADLLGFMKQVQPTIFDRLNEKGIGWRIYFHDIPQSLVFWRQRQPSNAVHYYQIDTFFGDAAGPETKFPQFTYIEPRYEGRDQNDDHPPHDIMKAQKLIADVYNAIRKNTDLWNSTLFVIFYDEHGGFYDHAPPPPALPPDELSAGVDCFHSLGVRVPALLISPRVAKGVIDTQFDHTSFLKYLTEKWDLEPLTERVKAAANFDSVIQPENIPPRPDTPPAIALSAAELSPPDSRVDEKAVFHSNAHQEALHAFVNELDVAMPKTFFQAERVYDFISRLPILPSPIFWALKLLQIAGKFAATQRRVVAYLELQKAKANYVGPDSSDSSAA